MRLGNILLILCIMAQLQPANLFGQMASRTPLIHELPIVLSWDEKGIRIAPRQQNSDAPPNLLHIFPSQFLEQIGTDLVRVTLGAENAPVIIDLSNVVTAPSLSSTDNEEKNSQNVDPQVTIEMPKLLLSDYREPNSFLVELKNFSKEAHHSKQTFLFKGLDVFNVISDVCAELSGDQKRISLDVKKCNVQHLLFKGGMLALDDLESKIPELCRKYNERYFGFGQPDAFVCLEECEGENPDVMKNLKHTRNLITKYSITDFEDEPISFLGDILLTKKGVGLNLKMEMEVDAKFKGKNNSKSRTYGAYDEYRFFPWHEFINLSFSKYMNEKQLMIEDTYSNSYIYNSDVYFSNVELIQFFNELTMIISSQVN